MGLVRARLRHRIALPFTALLVVAIAATAVVSVRLISQALESRFDRQLEVVAELIARSEFAENRLILERVQAIVDADVLTLDADGRALASTLAPAAESEWVETLAVAAAAGAGNSTDVTGAARRIEFADRTYTIVDRRLLGAPERRVVLLKTTEDLAQAVRSIAQPIALLAFVLIVSMTLLSVVVTRGITSPLQTLVESARRLGARDWDAAVEIDTNDEVGELARAFNDMAADLRRAEQKLLHSEKLAVTGQLAARVAHDIRNPLSSIKMRAQLVCSRLPPGDEKLRWLEPLLEEIEQVEWVVQGLLETARPGELDLEESDLNDVLARVLQALDAHLRHARVKIEENLDPTLPTLPLDRRRLNLALVNVVRNAVEAMPDGGTLEVRTRRVADEELASVEITDHGEGIADHHRSRLFDPFFTTKRDGVGLGLVNAKHIVEGHGGTIELLPRAGGGTRALIKIPLRPPEPGERAADRPEVGRPPDG